MQYLIDTHICLWAISDYEKISAKVQRLLKQSDVKLFVSQISLLEIAIKLQTGKLVGIKIPMSEFIEWIYDSGFEILPFKNEHAISYSVFNFSEEHKDPFDRYLAATACFEKMAFITKDEKFQLYTDRLEIVW